MSTQQDKVASIFDAAVELQNPAQRAAYLDNACGQDPELRAEIEQLLKHDDAAGSFLNKPARAAAGATVDEPPLAEAAGTVIGPYKLLQQIGEGGMGTVFMAEQTHPVQRKVALKVIKAGMDSRQVIARFEAERQALAMMDHVNIARVLDAGTTESGLPYFVMELVHGVPITKYCDDNHLTPRQRLELFVPVCQAIQHAHQKGIIHRDVKPSNVMITLYDGKPVPKVIDFGVAKATEQKLTERTLFTQYGTMVGTLEYMSPEQAEMSALGVDTRSDIFSLGVLLYELLTGNTPLSHKRVKEAAYAEILRMIKEEEPPKPSTRLSDSGEALASISANRHMEPAKLTKLVRGELDWIVMKTLEKDRNRRYETANGFAMDVQRYLADEPVQACPPSAWYRFCKFARRNKRTLATAALFGILLVAAVGGVTGTVGWAVRDREAREQDLAQKAARDREAREQELARKAERDRAARQGQIAAQVDLIMGEVEQLEKKQKWPEALAAARRAQARAADGADAATRERVRQVLHDLEMVAGLEELRLREAPGDKPGRGNLDEGLPRLYAAGFRDFGVDVETLPAGESAARLRGRPAVAIVLAAALDDWARAGRQRAPDQSKRLWALAAAVDPNPWRVSVRQASAALDVGSLRKLAQAPDTARQPPQSQLLLGSSLWLCGQPEQALTLLERACEIHPGDFWIHYNLGRLNWRVRPARLEAAVRHDLAARALRPQSAGPWNNLGLALAAQRKLGEAIACYRKAIDLEPKHLFAHNNLGIALREHGKLDEAIRHCRKAIQLDPKFYPGYGNLGVALSAQGKRDGAIACYRKAIELAPKDDAAHCYLNLGNELRAQGKRDEAIACYRKACELGPKVAGFHFALGQALRFQNKLDEAVAAYRKAIELEPKNVAFHSNLGDALRAQNKLDEAVAAYRKVIQFEPKNAIFHSNLGRALAKQGKLDEAIASHRRAIELNPKAANNHIDLGRALAKQGKLNEAIASHRRAIELNPNYTHALGGLVVYLGQLGKLDEAIAALKRAIRLEPGNADYHFVLGEALRHQKKLDEAIPVYRRAIQLKPQELRYRYILAQMFQLQGKHSEAIAEYRQAVRIKPDAADAHWHLGNALRQHHKLDEAVAEFRAAVRLQKHYRVALIQVLSEEKKWDELIACFQEAIELEPNAPWTHQQLAWVLATCPEAKWRDSKRAVASAKRAVELAPKDGNCLMTLGVTLYRAGDWKAGALALEKSMALRQGWDGNGWFFLAMAHWRLGNRDEARKCYDRVVQWMNKHQPEVEWMNKHQNEEPRRFRAEAAELLGRKEKKD